MTAPTGPIGGVAVTRPGERRPAIDVARVGALGIVVLGHLTLAVIDRAANGTVRGTNLLALRPGWAWIAVCSPMPLFFAAAGWANATSSLRSSAPRLRALVGLGATVVCAWVALLAATALIAGSGGVVATGARIATQPLWFLAAYVPFASAGPLMAWAGRHPVRAVGACLVLLVALDAARFALDAPAWIGWPGFAAAWAVPWILGGWWRRRCELGRFPEVRVGVALAAVGTVGCVVLVATAGYSPALIDAVEGARSNTTPPTVFTAVAGIAQVGVLLVAAPLLDRVGRRFARSLARAGEGAVGVYVLHLSALALCAGAVGLGVPVPTRLTTWWWLSRPLWFAAVLLVTAALVQLVAVARRRLSHGRSGAPVPASTTVLWLGVVLVTVGAAVIGLKGPRTPVTATLCVVTFVAGWRCLGGAGRSASPRGSPPTDSPPTSPA